MKTNKVMCLVTLAISGVVISLIGCAGSRAGRSYDTPVGGLTSKPTTKVDGPVMAHNTESGKPTQHKPADVKLSPAQQGDELMDTGVKYLVSGNYPDALKSFQEVLKVVELTDPITMTAYYNIACTYSLMKDKKPALDYLDQAVKAGYDNRESIDADPDLAYLREMPEYKSILNQIPPITSIAPTPESDAAQAEAIKLIEDVRGLKFKSPPQYKTMAPDQFERAYGGKRSPNSILGFYRWADKTLYLKQGLDPVKFKGTRIHETFHALQDQLFNMGELHKTVKTIDGNYALTALIEGDATLTFIECMPGSMARMMIQSATPWRMMGGEPVYDESAQGEAANRAGAFGYSIAARFIQAVKDAQGWSGVNAMYTNIPQSTEQVLHPEKYINQNDPPAKVAIPDLSNILGAEWRMSEPGTQGEFMILIQLLTNPKSGPLAEEAAAGWGGDAYFSFANKAQRQAFSIHKTVWDTPKDATEYFDAMSLAFERETPPEKGANYIKHITPENTVEYLAKTDTGVLSIFGIPVELLDKVLQAVK